MAESDRVKRNYLRDTDLFKNPIVLLLILLLGGAGGGVGVRSLFSGHDAGLTAKVQLLQVEIKVLQTVVENLAEDVGEMKTDIKDLTKSLRDVRVIPKVARRALCAINEPEPESEGYYGVVLDLQRE